MWDMYMKPYGTFQMRDTYREGLKNLLRKLNIIDREPIASTPVSFQVKWRKE